MAPFGALPLFQACLRRAGHNVVAFDLAAATFHWQIQPARVDEFYDYARSPGDARLRQGLERRLAIPEELVRGAARAARELRDPAVYFEPARMRERWDCIYAALELFACLRPTLDPRSRDFTRSLHAYLEGGGGDAITDRCHDSMLYERLRAFGPELVAISLPFSTQIASTMQLGGWIHRRFPGCSVVAGGTGISDIEEVLLADERFFDWIDFACVGDGEEALVELAAALGGRGELADVPALFHRSHGRIVPPRNRRLANMDANPTPDFAGLDFEAYLAPEKVAILTTSRGCYYGKCTFCPESFRVHWRRRSSSAVWQDVRHIAREQGITNFMFWDPLTPPAVLTEISERAAEERLDINWAAEVKFESHYTDRDYVRTLARGGCSLLQFGLESAVQPVLDAMVKGNDLAEIDVILDRLQEVGIAVGVFWFIGFPTELEDEARETWRFIARNRARIAFNSYIGTFGLAPNVPVFHDPERYGIEIIDAADGVPTYRRRDGKDWDLGHLDRTFHARNDIHMIQSGPALLYSGRRKERRAEISTHARTGPPVFLRALRDDQLTIPPRNGLRLATGEAGGEGHAYAYVAGSGCIHDLAPEDVQLVQSVAGGAHTPELLARFEPGILERLTRLVDWGILDRRASREHEHASAERPPATVAR